MTFLGLRAGVAGSAVGPAGGVSSARNRRATIHPSQPRLGQRPRHVTRPLGAFAVCSLPHFGQVPLTSSSVATRPSL